MYKIRRNFVFLLYPKSHWELSTAITLTRIRKTISTTRFSAPWFTFSSASNAGRSLAAPVFISSYFLYAWNARKQNPLEYCLARKCQVSRPFYEYSFFPNCLCRHNSHHLKMGMVWEPFDCYRVSLKTKDKQQLWDWLFFYLVIQTKWDEWH